MLFYDFMPIGTAKWSLWETNKKLYLWIVILVKFAMFSWLTEMKTYFNVFNWQFLWHKKIRNNFQKKDCNIHHSHKKSDFYGPYSRLCYFLWLWINSLPIILDLDSICPIVRLEDQQRQCNMIFWDYMESSKFAGLPLKDKIYHVLLPNHWISKMPNLST